MPPEQRPAVYCHRDAEGRRVLETPWGDVPTCEDYGTYWGWQAEAVDAHRRDGQPQPPAMIWRWISEHASECEGARALLCAQARLTAQGVRSDLVSRVFRRAVTSENDCAG